MADAWFNMEPHSRIKGFFQEPCYGFLAHPPNPAWGEKPSQDYSSKFNAQVHKLSPKVKDLICPGLDSLPRRTLRFFDIKLF